MARHVAFLRAINVGGRRISNPELQRHFEALGFEDVTPYQAAGNVIFEAADDDVERLSREIDEGLSERLGYDCTVYLRNAAEVRAIAAAQPLDAAGRKLHVALLERLPEDAIVEQVLALATDHDRLAFGTRELYWSPRGAMMESGLDLRALERLVGGWTMRTKGTIERIASRFFADLPDG